MSATISTEPENLLPRLTYGVDEVAQIFGVSRSVVFELLRDGALKRSKILGRTVVHRDEVQRFAASLKEGAA